MRRRNSAQIARLLSKMTNLITATHAVVVIVMSTRDQLWCAGGTTGKLEIRHFIGRRRRGAKISSRLAYRILQVVLALIIEQQHHAHGVVLRYKRVQKIVTGEQRVLAIGNQQRRLNLCRISIKLSSLMAE